MKNLINLKISLRHFPTCDLLMNGLLKDVSKSPFEVTFPNALVILRMFAFISNIRSANVHWRFKNYSRSVHKIRSL